MPVDRISTKAGRGESGSRDWQSGTLSVVFMGELPEEVNRGTMCGKHLPLEEFKEEHVRWREPQGHRGWRAGIPGRRLKKMVEARPGRATVGPGEELALALDG